MRLKDIIVKQYYVLVHGNRGKGENIRPIVVITLFPVHNWMLLGGYYSFFTRAHYFHKYLLIISLPGNNWLA